MFDSQTTLDSATGAALHLYSRRAEGRSRGVVLVQHGLAEHAGRYGRVAGELAALGLHVIAHDHRGHGSTAAPDAPLRRFARRDGAAKVLADCRAVHREALRRHPGLPVVFFGHSMGGLIALNYAILHGEELAGAAIWNADFTVGAQQRLAVAALAVEKALKGSDVPSSIVQRATFDAWGRSIEPRRTMFDWLSHDRREVDAYIADPLCGWSPTISMMRDVLDLIFRADREAALAALPRDLPLHLLGGGDDPVTAKGKALADLARRLGHAGSREVTLRIIPEARHETLHETERFRAPALAALIDWLERVVPAG